MTFRISSSAPINYYYGGRIPSGSYYATVTRIFKEYNEKCPEIVHDAFVEAERLLRTERGATELQRVFNWCTPLKRNEFDAFTFYIQNAYATLAMANYPWRSPNTILEPWPLRESCFALLRDDAVLSPLERLARSIRPAYNMSGAEPCLAPPHYPCADPTGCGDDDVNGISWDFQSCTQLVPNVDTNNRTDMFPPKPYDFESLKAYCAQQHGTIPRPDAPHKAYDLTHSSRLLISNGLLDPWFPGGVYNCTKYKDSHCLLIRAAAHHLDFYGDAAEDPDEVRNAREQERDIIATWTKQISRELKSKL